MKIFCIIFAKVCLEPIRTFMVDIFCQNRKRLSTLTSFVKKLITDVWLDSKDATAFTLKPHVSLKYLLLLIHQTCYTSDYIQSKYFYKNEPLIKEQPRS